MLGGAVGNEEAAGGVKQLVWSAVWRLARRRGILRSLSLVHGAAEGLLKAVQDGVEKAVGEKKTLDAYAVKYGGRLLGGSNPKSAAAQEALVHQATLLDGCLDGGQYLPIFYTLKVGPWCVACGAWQDELALSPVDISLTLGITALPFILKPGLAVVSDRWPIFGRKRTPYLAGSLILVAGTYAGASVAQSYATFLAGERPC